MKISALIYAIYGDKLTSSISGFIRLHMSPGSSVSIVSDYGLDNRAIGVRSPAGAKDFSCSLCVWGPLSLLYNGYRRSFPRGVTLTTHPHLVPRSSMSRSYTSSPKRLHVV
jgi:hypothetical protein